VRVIVVAAIALAGLPFRGVAQELRGVVRDSASRRPITGTVLLLLDSAGATLGRNITNERGEYRIALMPAIRSMRVQRIGFRPRTVTVPRVESGVANLDVSMLALPTFLEPVKVVDRHNCPRRSDAAIAVALWDQARAALLATVVAREANPAIVVRLRFDRRMDKERIVEQSIRADTASTSRPFIAVRPAAEFVNQGFLVDSAGKAVLAAPDADVMLDDAFGAGYCFRVAAADASNPHEIGIAFTPASLKRGRIDINGALWIDSTTRSLTRLEYGYLGLDSRIAAFNPGGHVEFRPMPNGSSMIDRWFIRVVGVDSTISKFDQRRGVGLEAHEVGGEIALATWPDGKTWHASLGGVKGRVSYRDTTGTRVTLELFGTTYKMAVDSSGAFQISDLLPGPYRIVAVDPRLSELGIVLKTGVGFTAERDSTTTLLVEIPSAEEYVEALYDEKPGPNTGTFLLRVNLPDGTPAKKARVVMHPFRDDNEKHVIRVATDDHGLTRVCNVPQSLKLEARATADGNLLAVGVREIDARLVTMILQLKLSPP
jgi:hypothetical protein